MFSITAALALSVAVCTAPDAAEAAVIEAQAAGPVLSTTAALRATPNAPTADSALLALYAAGQPWTEFLDAARARREMWLANAAHPLAPADAVARARALPGRWRLLVVAVDACSDSVNTIPFIAQLVAQVPQLEMRVISPSQGRELMEARRTPDGRPATPTVVILDAEGREAGCWIERPAALQALAIEARAGGGSADFAERKASWYASDAGASTVAEVLALLEQAAAGARGCDAPRGAVGR